MIKLGVALYYIQGVQYGLGDIFKDTEWGFIFSVYDLTLFLN